MAYLVLPKAQERSETLAPTLKQPNASFVQTCHEKMENIFVVKEEQNLIA